MLKPGGKSTKKYSEETDLGSRNSMYSVNVFSIYRRIKML